MAQKGSGSGDMSAFNFFFAKDKNFDVDVEMVSNSKSNFKKAMTISKNVTKPSLRASRTIL